MQGRRTPTKRRLCFLGSSANELRLKQFCDWTKSKKQNAELPLNADEQYSLFCLVKFFHFQFTLTRMKINVIAGGVNSLTRNRISTFVMADGVNTLIRHDTKSQTFNLFIATPKRRMNRATSPEAISMTTSGFGQIRFFILRCRLLNWFNIST